MSHPINSHVPIPISRIVQTCRHCGGMTVQRVETRNHFTLAGVGICWYCGGANPLPDWYSKPTMVVSPIEASRVPDWTESHPNPQQRARAVARIQES